MRIAIFIITTVKSIVIGLLPILMIQTMGDENYSESFYLSIYIMKCIFSLIAVWRISAGLMTLLHSFDSDKSIINQLNFHLVFLKCNALFKFFF